MVQQISFKEGVKVRKEHFCHGCLKKIKKGEIASVFTGKEDNEIYSLHTCEDCENYIKLPDIKEKISELLPEEMVEGYILELKNGNL